MKSSPRILKTLAFVCLAAALPATVLATPRLTPHAAVAHTAATGAAAHLRTFDRLRLDGADLAKRVRTTGTIALETSYGRFEVELAPHDMRGADYRADAEGPRSKRAIDRGQTETYAGGVRGIAGAQARFTVRDDGIEGIILSGGETYFLEPLAHYEPLADPSEYAFYRGSDFVPDPS